MAVMHMPSSALESGATLADHMMDPTVGHDAPVSQQTPGQHHRQETPSYHSHTPPHQQQQQQQQLPTQQNQQQQHNQQPRSVKRPRPVKSCTECRKRKLRCDRLCPCSQCQKSGRVCKYAAENDLSNLSDVSDNETAEPIRSAKRHCPPGTLPVSGTANSDTSYPTIKNGEQPGLLMLEELSSRMERLEKQYLGRSPGAGDLYPGRIAVAPRDTIRGLSAKRGMLVTRYFGQSSPRVLMNLFNEAKNYMDTHRSIAGAPEVLFGFHQLHKVLHDNYQNSLAPITVFVDSMMPVLKRMTDIMPKKAVCDRLLAAYINTSENSYRILHMPSFTEQYSLYWEGKVQYESFVPQLLTVFAIASRFETKSKGLGHERAEGIHIPTACALVRSWLDGLKGKQLVDLTTLQVELLLLHAQRMMMLRSEDGWSKLGYIVRVAMTMGLHRDPSEVEPRISVFVGELRRRLWFTLIDMDLHISLACNLPCLIRSDDYSCRPPRNLDDADLFPDMKELPPAKPIEQKTDNQTQVYAAMTMGVRLKVASLVHRVDTIRDFQEVLDVGAKLDSFLEDINYIFPRHGILDDSEKSKLWRSRILLDMHVRRPLIALYRPFAIGAPDVPHQISRAYLRSTMIILKYLDEIDPLVSYFQDIKDMYHMVLKRDIIQAAFSVCYYIRSAVRSGPGGLAGTQVLGLYVDSSDEYSVYAGENLMLWPPSRLIGTVEKVLDLLIRYASGSDIKDIVCLAVVLESVRTAEPKDEDITKGLRVVLDHCYRSTNPALEKTAPSTQGPSSADPFQSERYGHGRIQPMYEGNTAGMAGSYDQEGWMMWVGWD